MTVAGMCARRARSSAYAPGEFETTSRISSGKRPSRTASMTACRLVPLPDTKIALGTKGLGGIAGSGFAAGQAISRPVTVSTEDLSMSHSIVRIVAAALAVFAAGCGALHSVVPAANQPASVSYPRVLPHLSTKNYVATYPVAETPNYIATGSDGNLWFT